MALFDLTKVWWASKGVWGAVFVIIGSCWDVFGPNEQAAALELLMRVFEIGGGFLALVGRLFATKEIRR